MRTKKRRRSAGKSRKKSPLVVDINGGESIAGGDSISAGDIADAAQESGRVGPVERARVSVEVDSASLTREADAVAAAAPPDLNAAPATSPDQQSSPLVEAPAVQQDPNAVAMSVSPAMQTAVYEVARFVAPNWNVTREESAPVGESLALALAYWMPQGAIEPKYMALFSLGMSVWNLASSRRDPETGEFIPLRVDKQKRDDVPVESPTPQHSLAL